METGEQTLEDVIRLALTSESGNAASSVEPRVTWACSVMARHFGIQRGDRVDDERASRVAARARELLAVPDWVVASAVAADACVSAPRAGEGHYRLLYEQSPIGIELYDATGKLIDANRACLRLFGVGDVALVRGFDLFADPNIPVYAIDGLKRGESVRFETRFDFEAVRERSLYATTRSGWVEIDCLISPLRSDPSEVMGYLAYVWDISERRHVEHEREAHRVKAEEAKKLESLSVLAGGIAHDFNNLLMGVLGNLELVQADLTVDSPCQEAVCDAINAARRAAVLSNQMLAYSGKGRFISEPVDVVRLVNAALNRMIVSGDRLDGIVVRRHLSPDVLPVWGDADRLLEMFTCILTNAREALGEGGGTLSITCEMRDLTAAELALSRSHEPLVEGPYCWVEIGDTGCGMDETGLERVFDPFYSTKFVGRGLGLAVVHGIVRAHRGAIFLRSRQGEGTTVAVAFPVTSREVVSESGAVVPLDTILIVDDEKHVRSIASNMLRREGFNVLVAGDGLKALQVLENHAGRIGCVLLDLSMPYMDGEETFRRIRQAGMQMPVILSSGYDEKEATQRFDAADLVGFLRKPYAREELLAIVKKALRGP